MKNAEKNREQLISNKEYLSKGNLKRRLLHNSQKFLLKTKTLLSIDVIELSAQPFFVCSPDGRILYCNQAFCKLTGYTREELSKITSVDLTPLGWHEYETMFLKQVCCTGQAQRYEKEYIRKNGSRVPVEIFEHQICDIEGNIVLYYSYITNISERKRMEKSLAKQSRILELFFENSLSAIAILDREFNFIRVNEAYAKADDRNVSEFPGHNHFEFYPSDAKEIFEEVVETKEPYRIYARPFVYADHPERGTTYWDWTLVPVLDDRGEVEFLIYTLNNVTERIKKEIELERFFNLSKDILCISDFDGYFRRVSPSIEEHIGYSQKEVNGKPFHNFIYPEDLEGAITKRNGAVLTNNSFYCYRNRYRCKDGTDKWFEWTSVPSPDEGLVYSVARDITKNKVAEDGLLKLASIVESSEDAIISKTLDGLITCWNSGAEKIYGYVAEEVKGKPISILVPPDNKNEMEDILARISKGERIKNYETVRQRKNGKLIQVSVTVSPIKSSDGLIIGASVITRDISERKQVEREMARLDSLNLVGQMAAGIGHEIRNPMTTIRGFLQLLMSKKECLQFREYFTIMITELDRANSIITEYLSLSRNKLSEMKMDNITSIVHALSPLITSDAMNSSKDISFELEDVPDIMLNEKEIRQLILNLTRNGLEAMPGGGRLAIKTYTEGEEVVLAVLDQGEGIDSSVLEKIGTPFLTTKENGTGLGLATCYSIAARSNARIDIETGSTGTTFFVRFKTN